MSQHDDDVFEEQSLVSGAAVGSEEVSEELLTALKKAKASKAKVSETQASAQTAKSLATQAESDVQQADANVVTAQEQAKADADAALLAVRKELGLE